MKKISCALMGATLLTSMAMASDASPMPALSPASNFSGFYSGLTFGQGSGHSTIEIDSVKSDFALKGMNGGVFLGYGKELGTSRVYLGLEAAYLMSGEKLEAKFELPGTPRTSKVLGDAVEISLKKKRSLEIAARVGVVMNNTMPYIKIGVASSQFQLKGSSLIPSGGTSSPLDGKKRSNGLVVGTGIDLKISRNMMMGLGYTYTAYKAFTKNANVQDMKPVSHNVMFRLGYVF